MQTKFPKAEGEFSGTAPEELLHRLRAIHGKTRCSLCGSQQWLVPAGVIRLTLEEGALALPSFPPLGILPSIVMVCKVCANTVLINLVQLTTRYEMRDRLSKAVE